MSTRLLVFATAVVLPLAAACSSGSGATPAGSTNAAARSTVASTAASASSAKSSSASSAAATKPTGAPAATVTSTGSTAAATTAAAATATAKRASTVAPVEDVVAGDIPDNQAFVTYSPPSGGYSIKVPEGWARTTDGAATVFSDKFNSIRIEAVPLAAAPTVASVTDTDVAAIATTAKGFAAGKVSVVKRKAGSGILATYQVDGASNGVTDKIVKLDVERYVFWRSGTAVVVTLAGAAGSDNVDPWKIVTDGFVWA